MEQQYKVYSYRWVVLGIYMYVAALNSATGQFVMPLVMLVVLLLISFTIALFIRDTRPGSLAT